MKTIMLISPIKLSANMTGPAIRYWEFANYLSKYFNIILLCPDYEEDIYDSQKNRICIQKISIYNLFKYSKVSDVIVLQGLALWKYPFLKWIKKPIVIDLYDPFHLENLELYSKKKSRNILYKTTLQVILEQLYYGDFFICASEKQKDYWLGLLTAAGRINYSTYDRDKTYQNLISVVSFGLSTTDPKKTKSVLKGVHPKIKITDKVIIWGGGIWDWLDPETLIRGLKIVLENMDNVKLFFMGVKFNHLDSNKLNTLKKLVSDFNLEDHVIFNDWVKYEERVNYLLEADLGVSLHYSHIETRYSFRTRILDYFWCELPIISTEGDVLSDVIEREYCGIVVKTNNANDVANAIIEMLSNIESYKNFSKIKQTYNWETVIQDLIKFCEHPHKTSPSRLNIKEITWLYYRIIYYSSRLISRILERYK